MKTNKCHRTQKITNYIDNIISELLGQSYDNMNIGYIYYKDYINIKHKSFSYSSKDYIIHILYNSIKNS